MKPNSRLILSLIFSFFCIFLACIAFADQEKSVKEVGANYVAREVLVRFDKTATEAQKEEVRKKLGALLVKSFKSIRAEHWRLVSGISTEEGLRYLATEEIIDHAEPNFLGKPQLVPNDSHFNEQWFLKNTGQSVNGWSGVAGADISVTDAWNITTGKQQIIVAVIDSGVAFDHPDLKDNVWQNSDEIAGNGVDDDNNGYIDDVNGWDFVNSDNNPSDYSSDLYSDGHGTHVAGIIAAKGNNGLGTAGVMWQAQIMPLQVFDLFIASSFSEALIQSARIIESIEYAVDNGAKIINLSLGGWQFSQLQYDVIKYANENGALIIAASGNDGLDNDSIPIYPASFDLPNIISVTATNQSDELSLYANYGPLSVDVAAPGGNYFANILSTTPPERVTLFYDDFEDGGSLWATDGLWEPWAVYYDPWFSSYVASSNGSSYQSNERSYLETISPIDASDCQGLHLRFKVSYDLEHGYDFLYVESSNDGLNYSIAYYTTGSSFGVYEFSDWKSELELSEFYLRFSLETDYSNNYDGVSIDDIILTGVPWFFDGSEYDFKSGTSMAAPVVSGLAGLIWSANSSLSHLEVKDIIMNSTDQLDSLHGQILSGGRVNAWSALGLAQEALYNSSTLVADDLWLRAVVHTDGGDAINGKWFKGGEDTTESGDRVIWGYFYVDPDDESWGSENNPELFVKTWFDSSGRIDVNFFHVSVPDIEVFSSYPQISDISESTVATLSNRYIRHNYQDGLRSIDVQNEDGQDPADFTSENNPAGFTTINNMRIGAIINTVDGPIEGIWQQGGVDTTERGDQVVWGHFYADPNDVKWGNADNPEIFVKVWFDVSGRIDVNFFHVSVPDIEVFSDLLGDNSYDKKGTATMENRYIRHMY